MKLNRIFIIIPVFILILSACSGRPAVVLSEKKMADVLYDVHLAEAEMDNNYNLYHNNSSKKQELLDAIFSKHQITEAKFDTSLVWYNAHLERYLKVCEQVQKRYTEMSDTLNAQLSKEALLIAERNRVNIWTGPRGYLLQSNNPLENTITFNIDSIDWKMGDNLEISFDVLGINKSVNPEILFYTICEDTVLLTRSIVGKNGSFTQTIHPDGVKVKTLSGSIHIPGGGLNAPVTLDKFAIFHRKQGDSSTLSSPQKVISQ